MSQSRRTFFVKSAGLVGGIAGVTSASAITTDKTGANQSGVLGGLAQPTEKDILSQMSAWANHGRSAPAVEPVYYPAKYKEDFYIYHPQDLPSREDQFRVNFELAKDIEGPYFSINAGGEGWSSRSKEIMSKLRLRPIIEDGQLVSVADHSLNEEISSGWRAIGWETAPTVLASGARAFLDEITWVREGVTVVTAWAWLVY